MTIRTECTCGRDEQVERVAKALYNPPGWVTAGWEDASDDVKEHCRTYARRAIAALAEPEWGVRHGDDCTVAMPGRVTEYPSRARAASEVAGNREYGGCSAVVVSRVPGGEWEVSS